MHHHKAIQMSSNKEIHVFESFRPFLRILQVYNSNNIPVNRMEKFYQIVKIIGFSFLVLLCLTIIAFGVWFCVIFDFRFDKAAQPIAVLLYSAQLLCMYSALIIQNRRINAIVDRMHDLINQRK